LAIIKRVTLIIAVIFALSTFILGVASLIGIIMGKLSWRKIIPRVIPMIGVGLLIWAILNLLEVQNYTYKLAELNTINLRTMIIFFRNFCFWFCFDRKFNFFQSGCLANRRNAGLQYYFLFTSIRCSLSLLFYGRVVGSVFRTWALDKKIGLLSTCCFCYMLCFIKNYLEIIWFANSLFKLASVQWRG
jgi:hypothetical protein